MFRRSFLQVLLALFAFQDNDSEYDEDEKPKKEPPKPKEYPVEKGDYVGTSGKTKYIFRTNKDLLREETPTHVFWFKDGELHRDGGPALEFFHSRVKKWYKHGKLHREDGPAVEAIQFNVWYLEGEFIRSAPNV